MMQRHHGEREQRNLFKHQAGKLFLPFPSGGSVLSFRSSRQPPARKRPPVQEQKHKRQRHQHPLGSSDPGRREPPPGCNERATAASRVARVSPQRQHEKQSAQHILALRHPRHRTPRAADAPQTPPPQTRCATARPVIRRSTRKSRIAAIAMQQDIGQMMPARPTIRRAGSPACGRAT